MRHKYKGRKLGTDWSHTKAMKRSLVQQLLLNDRIKTIESRAKEIRGDVDKIITWAKRGDLHSRRLAIAALGGDKELVREVFEKVDQGMFAGRNGGYTRIMKLGPRKGDNAPMVIMEMVNETVVPKADKKTADKKAAPKKAAPKKAAAKETKAEDKDEKRESVVEELHDSIEAAEENFAAEVQEEGMEQLAEEKEQAKEAEAEAREAEEVREEQFKAEEKAAKDTEAAELKAEAEEKAK